MKWRITHSLLFAAFMEEIRVCAKETQVSISTLFTFQLLKINYSNTDDHMFHEVLNTKVRK